MKLKEKLAEEFMQTYDSMAQAHLMGFEKGFDLAKEMASKIFLESFSKYYGYEVKDALDRLAQDIKDIGEEDVL